MFKGVQHLRAIAACAVVLLHATIADSSAGIFRIGSAGVDLFFVVSGFIMAHVATGDDWRRFLGRRAWRIYPLWWCVFLAMLPAAFLAGKIGPGDLLRNLTLLPLPIGPMVPTIGWTLLFEMGFYIACALAMRVGAAIPLALFVAAFALDVPFVGNALVLEFLMGVAIARVLGKPRLPLLAVGLGLVLLAIAPTPTAWYEAAIWTNPMLGRAIAWGVPCALIVWGVVGLEDRLPRGGTLLGDASYSIYLAHPLAVLMLPGWPAKFVGGVVLGLVVHALIERPVMRIRPARLSSRREPPHEKATTAAA